MGDHFVLLVDRLLTESTLEAALESRNRAMQEAASSAVSEAAEVDLSLKKKSLEDAKSPRKIVECRICHDEDEDSNMETPCSCCGSLKYAHRRCVQRWCNEKGDTTCEICHQQFKPGYTAPPPLFQFGRIPMTFRGNWEISRRDLNSTHLVSMVSTDQNLINSNYDQYSASTSSGFLCCRSVALIFMVLLILRHALPLLISGDKDYSFSLFMLLLFRTAGIVLPVYFVVRAVTSIQRHRRQLREPPNAEVNLSDDDGGEQVALQSQLHVIRVQ
ncbi:E3 ubiquitin-protein ligase MARCH2 [Senna tora]|uniref:E3 ubiquitin-protein ligase MARCH2 n=1 Tax=Senna tora TaxID=362788 RepID=A0A834SQL2_9FABA|nr:E3 ubiquitin-protein ligase MARCH2 [Senna tora]